NVITKKEFTEKNSAEEIINNSYSNNLTDEFIEPVFVNGGYEIKSNDGLIFANFRSDRAVEITRMIYDANIENLKFVTMTNYFDDKDTTINIDALFGKEVIDNTLSEIISRNNLKQIKITETEKFVHLTFFFNAQKYESENGEDRIMIDSNKDVKTHDQKPEMKAAEISDQVVKAISEEKYSFIATNLVNCDMVGHTGNWEATIKGVEAVDMAIGKIIEEAKKHDAIVLITADHGNAEEKFDPITNQPITSHSLNPVPFIVFGEEYKEKQTSTNVGYLSDIAPTILSMLNLEIPKEMTGNILIK
ncbi:MAG: sulfatase-like hydrolase/transferase, partial [Patescibacteria group bacterium]